MSVGEQASAGLFAGWRQRRERTRLAEALYATLVDRARQPALYAEWGVPDTPDGRLEMVTCHVATTLSRLAQEGEEGRELAQALFDAMFTDVDRSLREMGVGDLSVGKKVKAIASSFFGRAADLDRALADSDQAAIERLLLRNVYVTGVAPSGELIAGLAAYLLDWYGRLTATPASELLAGRLPDSSLTP